MPQRNKKRSNRRNPRNKRGRKINQKVQVYQKLQVLDVNPGAANKTTFSSLTSLLTTLEVLSTNNGYTIKVEDIILDFDSHSNGFFTILPCIIKDTEAAAQTQITSSDNVELIPTADEFTNDQFAVNRLLDVPAISRIYEEGVADAFKIHQRIRIPREYITKIITVLRNPADIVDFHIGFMIRHELDFNVSVRTVLTVKYNAIPMKF